MGKEGFEPSQDQLPLVFETKAYTIPPLAQAVEILPQKLVQSSLNPPHRREKWKLN